MRLSDITILICSIPIVIIWIFGVSEDVNLDELQTSIEVAIVLTALVSVIPRMLKKLKGDTLKHLLGLFPTLGMLAVISWKYPTIDPNILEILAIILVITNLVTLAVVKRKLAKYLDRKNKERENFGKSSDAF